MAGITVAKAGAFGTGGAGVIGATGYGAYTLIQPKTIGEKLVGDKVELLEENETSTGQQLVSKYDADANKLNGTLNGTDSNQKAKDLQSKCKEFLNTPLTHTETADDANMTKAKRGCVKNPTVLTTNG